MGVGGVGVWVGTLQHGISEHKRFKHKLEQTNDLCMQLLCSLTVIVSVMASALVSIA